MRIAYNLRECSKALGNSDSIGNTLAPPESNKDIIGIAVKQARADLVVGLVWFEEVDIIQRAYCR